MSNLIASAVDSLIPVATGIFVTIVGFSSRIRGPRWNMLKRLRYLGPALIVFGGFLFVESAGRQDAPNLQEISTQIKERLGVPFMVDSATRVDDVVAASSQELLFVYTLVDQTAGSPELGELTDRLRAQISSTACQNQDWLTFLRAGVTVSLRYLTSDGTHAMTVVIHPEDCGIEGTW